VNHASHAEARGRMVVGRGCADAVICLPPMVTRAANFEDVMLRRVLQDVEGGFYIDIGAAHPVHGSATAWFYDSGWRGINVEPDPERFGELERARPRDTNLQGVVGASNGATLFHVSATGGAGAPEASARGSGARRTLTLPRIAVDHLLDQAGDQTVDFLRLDVDATTGNPLETASFDRCRPRLLVVAELQRTPPLQSPPEWEAALLSRRYEFAYFDGLSRFYVRAEDAWRKTMFALPPCALDNFLAPTLDEQRRQVEALRVEPALEQIQTLTASLAASEDERQAAEKEISRLKSQVAALEAVLTSTATERRRVQERLEAVTREFEARNQALGRLSDEVGAWDEARRWRLPPGRERRPGDRRSALNSVRRRFLLNHARRAAAARQWTVAAETFATVLRERSDVPFIWVEYGHALKESGALAEAVLAYRKVLLLMPDHPDIETHLADLLRRTGPAEHPPGPDAPWPGGAAVSEFDPTIQIRLIERDLALARPDTDVFG
jgi:FkbM family methyltransferase